MFDNDISSRFWLGSHLCREPMPPMAELKRDMETLKRHGFNLVKLQEHWMLDEPREVACDFSRYEELITHAAKLDMGVYLGLTCEQAPHWLYEKHPDCRMVGHDGVPIAYEAPTTLPADGKPGPCYDHPGAAADQARFITRLVATLGRFDNIVVWNTWQEIGYWSEAFVQKRVCFCPHTLARFRTWLKEQYGDLDALNRAWNTRYADWVDIQPTHAVGYARKPLAVDIAWQYFMDNVQVAGVLQQRAAAVKAADPRRRPVFAHKGGPAFGSGQDWTYARCQDFLGSSCYPAWGCGHPWDDGHQRPFARGHALLTETWDRVAYYYDYIRSANPPGRPLWAAEFQGGPVSTGFHKGRVPSAEDIRRWLLTAVASGVTAVSFWVTRAEIMAAECNGFSLLDSVGDSTPRLAEASRIGQALQAHADLFAAPTLEPAPVAILVNEWNHQLCSLLADDQGAHLAYATRGWHRLLWDAGILTDFLDTRDLATGRAKDYSVIVLPFPLSLDEQVTQSLAAYVRQGGCLVSEAAPGRIDAHGFCPRGELSPTMAELFGVHQESFNMVREPQEPSRWSPSERTWGEYLDAAMLRGVGPLVGQALRANVYVETFETEAAEPALMHGQEVAGVLRRFGDGSAWLLGTYVGHSGTAYRDAASAACVRAIITAGGVNPPCDGKLHLRRRLLPNKQAWIFTNPTEQAITERLSLAGWTTAADLLGEPLARNDDHLELTVNGLDVRVLIVTNQDV